MRFNMERWYSATGQRFSVRNYNGEPENDEIASLQNTARVLSMRGVRIELGMHDKAFDQGLLGTKMQGTSCFAAFISNGALPESIGYMGEAFILECTALGLGTCWVGATYNKGVVAKCVELAEGERVVCVTPIGIANERYVGRPRKMLSKLTGLTQERLMSLAEWQQRALECARLAPSAVNGQPWEFIAGENSITVKRTNNNFGYGALDCGIAMLHTELGAAHCGASGEWENTQDGRMFVVNNE
ncbi:MAG: nitroreductase family protein [Clostridia bacterium]